MRGESDIDIMPPPAVKTILIRDLIYWQYAKIISETAGLERRSIRSLGIDLRSCSQARLRTFFAPAM